MSDLHYRKLISYDAEKECFVARAPELEQCTVEGETAEAALLALSEEVDAQIENMKEAGKRPRGLTPDEVKKCLSRPIHEGAISWIIAGQQRVVKVTAGLCSAGGRRETGNRG